MKNIKYIGLFLLFMQCWSCSDSEEIIEQEPKIIDLSWKIGQNNYSAEVDGEMREFIVHVPASYDSTEAFPLLFMLHGSSGNGQKFYNISRWVEKSEEENFIAVFPTALEYYIVEKGRFSTKWSSEGLEKDLEEGASIKDDLLFFDFMLEALEDNFLVKTSRIYACGFSNGGGFIRSRLLLERPTAFAAFATSGGWGYAEEKTPKDGIRKPMYSMIGTRDTRIIENQDTLTEIPIFGSELLADSLYNFYTSNTLKTLGLESEYSEEMNPPKYNILTFDKPLYGNENEFKLMLINDMGHNFANGTNNPKEVVAVDHLWPWFMKWTR